MDLSNLLLLLLLVIRLFCCYHHCRILILVPFRRSVGGKLVVAEFSRASMATSHFHVMFKMYHSTTLFMS